MVPDDGDPGGELPLSELVFEQAGEGEVRQLGVLPHQCVLVLLLDVAKQLADLQPGSALRVGTGHLIIIMYFGSPLKVKTLINYMK